MRIKEATVMDEAKRLVPPGRVVKVAAVQAAPVMLDTASILYARLLDQALAGRHRKLMPTGGGSAG